MPGVRKDRWSNRKPQTYGYAAFSPYGPYFDSNLGVWIGGNFWDGRVVDLVGQAQQPPINPVEMANTPTNGVYPPVFGGYWALLAEKLQHRPYTKMLKEVWGPNVFEQESPQQIYIRFAQGVSAVQGSGEVCQFSSKWDASTYGTPPKRLYTLSASEERGRILYGSGPNLSNDPKFGSAQCFACHDSTGLANGTRPASDVPTLTQGKNTFTMYCYANIGVPKNVNNHYYLETDCQSNPGCNPLGINYIDYGLGANPNKSPMATPSGVPLNGGGTVFNNGPHQRIQHHPVQGTVQGPDHPQRGPAAAPEVREGVHAQRRLHEPRAGGALLQHPESHHATRRGHRLHQAEPLWRSRRDAALAEAGGPREPPERRRPYSRPSGRHGGRR